MSKNGHVLHTDRLILRNWQNSDREEFAALSADSEVMEDLGGPLNRTESDIKFNRYANAFKQHGFCRWAVEDPKGRFIGYTGVMPSRPGHPLGPHADVGWRLIRVAWGNGYATEAARAALADIFERVGLKEVLAYTAPNNIRSQAVMQRLGLERAVSLDYSEPFRNEMSHGLVWIARL